MPAAGGRCPSDRQYRTTASEIGRSGAANVTQRVGYVMYGQPVLRLVRFALLAVLAFLVLGLVVALGSPQTGPIEKAVLALAIVGLLAAGVPVRRIGSQA
jgi:hypothetical protein